MSPRRLFSLAAFTISAALSAHAGTIVTDNVVFTYTTSLGTEQNNFSFVDGSIATYYDQTNGFSLPVTVYPNTDQTGTPNAGDFYAGLGATGVSVSEGAVSASIYGYDTYGYISAATPIYQNGVETSEALFLNPGTYTFAYSYLDLGSTALDPLVSASFTITQTTSSTPSPVAATPEPSSLALLGTGILGMGGLVRRKVRAGA